MGAAAGQVHRDSPHLHCRQCQQRSGGAAEWVHSEDGVPKSEAQQKGGCAVAAAVAG